MDGLRDGWDLKVVWKDTHFPTPIEPRTDRHKKELILSIIRQNRGLDNMPTS